jgi:hypothetical protein
LAKDPITTNAIASSSLHPTTASVNINHHQQRPSLLQLPSTTASVGYDRIATEDKKQQPRASGSRCCRLDCVAAAMAVINGSNSDRH